MILPKQNAAKLKPPAGLSVTGVRTLKEAIQLLR